MIRDNLTLNETAAVQIFEEIANDANSLRHTFIDMECHGVRLEGSALALFRVFAEKIGWMAELGAKRISGIASIKGDAEDWLLSPVGADAVRATAKPKGHLAALVESFLALDDEDRQKLLDSLTDSQAGGV